MAATGRTPLFQPRDVDDTTTFMECLSVGGSVPVERRKRRGSAGRRVSFADITKVHVFARDDDYETPPEAQTEDVSTSVRRSPRLAVKLKRKSSLDEARATLAPRFDVATATAQIGASPEASPGAWSAGRGSPDSHSADMDLENTGPVDLRHLRSGDKDCSIFEGDADDVTEDVPRFAELLKADATGATCTAWDQHGFVNEHEHNVLEMSFTEIPSKWPIQRSQFAIPEAEDCTSDMSLSSDATMKQLIQATSEEERRGSPGFVEVEVVASPAYDEGMKRRDSVDMDMDLGMETPRQVAVPQLDRSVDKRPASGGKRKFATSYEKDALSVPSKGARRAVDQGPKQQRTRKSPARADKENQPPAEFTTPDSSMAMRKGTKQKGDLSTARFGLSLQSGPDGINGTEFIKADDLPDVLSPRDDISMAIPKLSDLLTADETTMSVLKRKSKHDADMTFTAVLPTKIRGDESVSARLPNGDISMAIPKLSDLLAADESTMSVLKRKSKHDADMTFTAVLPTKIRGDESVSAMLASGDISMAIPKLSDLLRADKTTTTSVINRTGIRDTDITATTTKLSSSDMVSGFTEVLPFASPTSEQALVTNGIASNSSATQLIHPDIANEEKQLEDAHPSSEQRGTDVKLHHMTVAQLLQIVKERSFARSQHRLGASSSEVMMFIEQPMSLAESLKFSCQVKPQMQVLEVQRKQLIATLSNVKASIVAKSLAFSAATPQYLQKAGRQDLQAQLDELEKAARKSAMKDVTDQGDFLRNMHENNTVLQKERQAWKDAKDSQKEAQELVRVFQETIAQTGLTLRHLNEGLSVTAAQQGSSCEILKQVEMEEAALKKKESLLAQKRDANQEAQKKLAQVREQLQPLGRENTVMVEHVRLMQNKLALLQKMQRVEFKVSLTNTQQQVLEVTYYNLVTQRFYNGGTGQELVKLTSLMYFPADIDKVYADMQASRIFLAALPPFDDVVLETSKLVAEYVQKTGRTVWKLVKLVEELQECRFRFLRHLTNQEIVPCDGIAGRFEIRLKFTDCGLGIRFVVKLYVDLSSLSLSGRCDVDIEYISAKTQSTLSAHSIVQTITSVQPGSWRIRRVCEVVKELLSGYRQ